jgi:lysophospholipase L1-like esterase
VTAGAQADRAVARTDRNSQIAHEQLLEKTRRGRIAVYFAGDSITRRWGATDYPEFLAYWRQTFFGWNAANFGWGGDRIEHMLWRVQNGELDNVHPKVIVLLAGTNNVGRDTPRTDDGELVTDVTRGIAALLDVMRAKAPAATIVLTAIFPRNDNAAVMPTIERINARLATLADGRAIRFLNVNDRLADARGRLYDGMMPDGLHPSLKGYAVWADGLRPILSDLLGPPAAEDHSPPPTGDPSATRK